MLQLDAKTKALTPASLACLASSTLARKLISNVTSSKVLPIGSFDIAAKMHDGIHPLQYFGPKPPHVRKILNVGPALRKDVRIRQAVRKVPLV